MNQSRSFLLLAGVALLGAMADAQASFLGATGKTARGISQSLQQSAVATYQAVTDKLTDATVQERPARVLASPQAEGRQGGESPSQGVSARSSAEPPAPAGNPLWALPLERLSITRERPIFSPSRRPPTPAPTYVAPVAVRQPAKPPEPERPAVWLIGTVIGTDVQIGIFLEKATHNVVRLHLGEEHQGWVLRLVKAREATLVKNGEQAVVLELPQPGDAPPPGLGGMYGLPPGGLPGGLPGVAPGTIPLPAAAGTQRQRRQR